MTPNNPAIVIPVYNGRDSVLKLIPRIKSITNLQIIIVDDGSSDGTSSRDFENVIYKQHSENRGKGAALKTGLETARSRGFSCVVTLDADGQHAPEKISSFLAAMNANPEALVVGMRNLVAERMPFHRKLSNNITSLMLSLRTGKRVRDSQVGYRCYPLNDSRLWNSIENGFQFESAVFFNAAKLKIPLVWEPIPVIYGAEDSHMDYVRDTLRFVRTFFRSYKW